MLGQPRQDGDAKGRRVMDGRTMRWIVAVAGVLVLAACATQQVGEVTGAFTLLPRIGGTEIEVPRQWGARGTSRDWKYIVIHHSASDTGGALVFDSWHRKRGFDELGYHFVIDNGEGGWDGKVEVGSRWLKQKHGAHAKSADGRFNEQGIGICLVGNFEKSQPTQQQWDALVKLVAYLARKYDIGEDRIIGHQDVNQKTACPGLHMDLPRLRHALEQFPG